MQPIELIPGMCIALSSDVYYSHQRALVSQEDKGWFLVQEAFCLGAGEVLGFPILPKRALRAGLRSWFPGKNAKGPSPGSGIYVAVEHTVLPVGLQVQLTAEKAWVWQFYLKEIGSEAFEVHKALPLSPGEWVQFCVGMESLPQQWIQLNARSFAEINREKLLSSEEMACQVYYVKESGTLPPGWILRLSKRQVAHYDMHTFETLKEPWYRNQRPIFLRTGDLIGINQGVVPKGLSVFEVPKEGSESVPVAEEGALGRFLRESGAMTLTDLGMLMPHCHRRGLLRQLQRLMDQGQVVRHGQGRATVYEWQTVDKERGVTSGDTPA